MNPEIKKIDFATPPRHRRKKGRPWLLVAIILILGALFFVKSLSSPSSAIFKAVFSQDNLKSANGRVNVLLLGIGGGNHDGADLTDSIIVASYDLNSHVVTLFSIPRDLYLPSIQEKVNTAYELGKSKGKSNQEGLTFAEDKIDDILGIPIQYGVLMDFSSFSKAIDLVGGVDVNVPNTLDDYMYPIEGKENDLCGWTQQTTNGVTSYTDPTGKVATDSATLTFDCRYEHIHFDKGITHMDGTTALKFVRSRHGVGVEGSDFARSKRQQLVIQAFRDKLLSVQTLANPAKIAGLISTFGSGVVTDIPQSDYPQMYSLFKNVSKVNSVVLGDLGGGKSLFINPPLDQYGGAWVLVPPNNDFTQVMQLVQTTLNPPSPTPSPSGTPVKK